MQLFLFNYSHLKKLDWKLSIRYLAIILYTVLYFIFYHLICKFLDICYMCRTVEAVGLCFPVCLYLFKIGLPLKTGKKAV